MRIIRNSILIVLFLLIGLFPKPANISAQEPVVRAVLLYSPSCPHCLTVINEILPLLVEQYGTSQLQIFGVNTYTETGGLLFNNAAEAFNTPQERQAVPTLIIGDLVLVGEREIAEQLPGLIEQGLSNGGIDWPLIPGLEEAMTAIESGVEETSSSIPAEFTWIDKFSADLAGNTLSVIILLGMLAALVFSGISLWKGRQADTIHVPVWLLPVLSIVGIGIAGYLSYVEVNQVEAVCGPVGNCNAVQQSSYATLFGVIPIGLLGIIGYLAVIILWLVDTLNLAGIKQYVRLGLWIITLVGTLFSIYLTFLEPFVIGATCMWCLSSAVIMTILYMMATRNLNFHFDEFEDQ